MTARLTCRCPQTPATSLSIIIIVNHQDRAPTGERRLRDWAGVRQISRQGAWPVSRLRWVRGRTNQLYDKWIWKQNDQNIQTEWSKYMRIEIFDGQDSRFMEETLTHCGQNTTCTNRSRTENLNFKTSKSLSYSKHNLHKQVKSWKLLL